MLGRLFSHRRHSFLSWWILFSLTELTDLTELFSAQFEPMRGRGQLLLVREVTPTKRLIKGEKTLFIVCKYYQKIITLHQTIIFSRKTKLSKGLKVAR
jgi:hypothetical protein